MNKKHDPKLNSKKLISKQSLEQSYSVKARQMKQRALGAKKQAIRDKK